MKQGTNFLMDVDINYDLDEISNIDFIFVQGEVRKIFHYPSSTAYRSGETNTIELIWTVSDTYEFTTKEYIKMDTHITLTDSDQNPPTTINLVRLAPTLFTQDELT